MHNALRWRPTILRHERTHGHLKNFFFAYPYTFFREPSSPKSIPPLPSYTQIAGHFFKDFPSYATTLAICHQWKYSYISLKANDQVASYGWASMGLLGEFCWPSSSNLTRVLRASSSRSAAARMIQPSWTGSLYTGLRNPNSKNIEALKTCPNENERCASSSPTSRWCLVLNKMLWCLQILVESLKTLLLLCVCVLLFETC